VTKDAYVGPDIQRQLVRIYILVGEPVVTRSPDPTRAARRPPPLFPVSGPTDAFSPRSKLIKP